MGILPLEEVEIVNIENGNRWNTYVLPGEAGSGQICPNGGGALLCKPGDILIVWANEHCDREGNLEIIWGGEEPGHHSVFDPSWLRVHCQKDPALKQ